MKRLSKLYAAATLLFCTSISGYSQNDLSIIQGEWVGDVKSQKMGLYEIKNGNLEELATSKIQNNQFSFAFTPQKEGYYAICGGSPMAATYRYVFYFKPGDDLSFKIVNDTYHLTGKDNSPENKAIEAWHELIQPLEGKAIYFMNNRSTYKDFFPQFEDVLPQIQKLSASKTPNKTFNKSFENYKKFDLLNIAETFLNTPRTEHPKGSDYIDYYRNINIKDLTQNTAILNYPGGVALIDKAYIAIIRANPNFPEEKIGEAMKNAQDNILKENLIANDTIKGELVLSGTRSIRTYPGIMEYKQKYAQYLVTDNQKARFNEIIAKYDDNSAGHDAIDFKFEDVNGKQVALSDFKGKVVYVDVWATWCGPCNREIPHMIKLEESYHNNPNIVFMSVSVDSRKDYDKWKNMLKEKGMGGIQLFAGERKDEIMNPYKINGIPRFMLFGKDGKVINADAPRPSSSEIKAVIDAAL